MISVNKIELIGNIGKKAVLKELSNGKLLYVFDLFTNDVYTDKNGERQSTPERHRIKAYGNTASLINEKCSEGDLVMVEGRMTYHEYDDGDRVAEVRCDRFIRFDVVSHFVEVEYK